MKSIIKDWYTGENIPVETRLPAYRRTARAGAGNGRTERPVHRCCFSERMRKLFRKNEKNVLRFCNKKAKEKRRLQRVKKPM